MRNILFDLRSSQPLGGTIFHGGGEYCKSVFFELVKHVDRLSCVYDSTLYLDPKIEIICKNQNFNMFDLNVAQLQTILDNNNFDIYYSALPEAVLNKKFNFGDCKYVGTIHGLRSLEQISDDYELLYPHKQLDVLRYYLNKYVPSFFKNRTIKYLKRLFDMPQFHCIVVSEHTKASLLGFLPELTSREMKVFYSPSTSMSDAQTESYFSDKYWLMVSGNRWVKNAYRGMLAFDSLFSERPEIKGKVVITGINKPTNFSKHLTNKSRFVFIDYIDNIDLERLYLGAYGLVYPTLNEGFGYPPVEAMRYGTPVLSSSFSSIPEISENAVIYFNPLSVSEIKNRILQLEDYKIHSLYSKRGIERYKQITTRQNDDLKGLIEYLVSL